MAVTLAPSAPPQTRPEPRPPCRIRRAPALEPPADEDRPADDHPVCAGQLALFTSVHGTTGPGRPAAPTRPAVATRRPPGPGPLGGPPPPTVPPRTPGTNSRAAPATDPHPAAAIDPRAAPATDPHPAAATGPRQADLRAALNGTRQADRRPAGGPPVPARVAAGRFVSACVEVLNGFRPVAHLRALTGASEFTAVATQLTRRTARVRLPEGARTGQERVRLRRLQVFEQRTGVAETVAVLRHGDTAWAMALRFERHRGGWLCTLLEVI